MSNDQDDLKDKKVGYGKPPKAHQFKKGKSGNPAGRPRKSGPTGDDIVALLNAPVDVIQDEKRRTMQPKEVSLRQIFKKAIAGGLREIMYLLNEFIKHGAIERPQAGGGVIELPSSMPFEMAVSMLMVYGEPEWTPRQIATAKAVYFDNRSEAQRKEDEAIGYPDL